MAARHDPPLSVLLIAFVQGPTVALYMLILCLVVQNVER